MATSWYMLTVVGKDQPGIVANLAQALYQGGCNLGEASMIRLGGSFTIMVMVKHTGNAELLEELVAPIAEQMHLSVSVGAIEGKLHQHNIPDVRITVSGADRAGIVAQVTDALASAGLNILDLRSAVAGSVEKPLYVMYLEGQAEQGIDALKEAISPLELGVEVTIKPVEIVVG